MIIDSHCHLNYDPLINSIPEIIKRAEDNGIKYMLTISTKDKEFADILDLVNKYENIYGTYGIHPHEANSHEKITVDTIINNINSKRICPFYIFRSHEIFRKPFEIIIIWQLRFLKSQ